jgi:hypothetical protein
MQTIDFQNFLKRRILLLRSLLKGRVSSGRSLAGLCNGPYPEHRPVKRLDMRPPLLILNPLPLRSSSLLRAGDRFPDSF